MKIFRSPQIIISRNGAKEPEKSISLYDVQPPNDATKTFNFAELKNKQSIEIPVQNGSLRFTRVDESNVQMPEDLMHIVYKFIPEKRSWKSSLPFNNVQGDSSIRLYEKGKGNNDKGQYLFPTHFPELLVSKDREFFLLENGEQPQVENLLQKRYKSLTTTVSRDFLNKFSEAPEEAPSPKQAAA
jgi:hypothetical protein